ncbi:hypothetical protein [Listeria goaensis]|uniref:hypothetical protein n=1 Tax=Listeria goaensis TaxID=1649188 RepID=UPI000B58A199|nr:hypothetical protein [Listeria goaensis]
MFEWRNDKLINAHFNNFNVTRCRAITSLNFRIEYNKFYEQTPIIILDIAYGEEELEKIIKMEFYGVDALKVNTGFFPYIQVMGFEINNIKDTGSEKKYEINDYEDGVLYFVCDAVRVVAINDVVDEMINFDR